MKKSDILQKIKRNSQKVAQVFRITDENGLISLTNITMMLVMYKIAVTPAVSMQDLTALALGVLGYQAKRLMEKK